jgi:Sec-independent protein translocase protein TatA
LIYRCQIGVLQEPQLLIVFGAIKNFRSSMREGESESKEEKNEKNEKDEPTSSTTAPNNASPQVTQEDNKGQVIEGQITNKQTHNA